jgi:hypothetical protein
MPYAMRHMLHEIMAYGIWAHNMITIKKGIQEDYQFPLSETDL